MAAKKTTKKSVTKTASKVRSNSSTKIIPKAKKMVDKVELAEEREYGLKEFLHGILMGLAVGLIVGIIIFKGTL